MTDLISLPPARAALEEFATAYHEALDALVEECFKVCTEEQIEVLRQPAFHIALDNAERLLRRVNFKPDGKDSE